MSPTRRPRTRRPASASRHLSLQYWAVFPSTRQTQATAQSGDPSITMATIDLILSGVSLEPESEVAEVSESLLPQDGHRYCLTPSFRNPSSQSGTRQSGHLRSLLAFRDIAAFSSLAAAFARLSFSLSRIPRSDPKSASDIADASSLVSIKKLLPGIWEASGGRSLSPSKPIPGASQILRFAWHRDYSTAGFLSLICPYIR